MPLFFKDISISSHFSKFNYLRFIQNSLYYERINLNMRKNIILLLIMILILPIMGCQNGPGNKILKEQVQNKLDSRFQASLFEIDSMRRNGSYFFSDKNGKNFLLIYFKTKIHFQINFQYL